MQYSTKTTGSLHKHPLRLQLLLLFVMILSGCSLFGSDNGDQNMYPTLTPPSNLHTNTDTSNNIHAFQTFTYSIDDPTSVAKHYDFVWGVEPKQLAAFRSTNPNAILSYYFPFRRDGGDYADQSTWKQHGLSYWKAKHPDWVLYQCDRKTPALEDSADIGFDFTNQEVIDWQVQTYAKPASEAGYDAIAADNLNLQNIINACGFYKNGQWVQRYTGKSNDPQWRKDVLFWVAQMQKALYALPHPLALIPNFGLGSVSPTDPIVQQIVQHSDALLDEGGFTNYGDGYVTGNAWVHLVQFMQYVQQQGKTYYILNEFKTDSLSSEQLQWALASYLMGKDRSSAIYISRNQQYGSALYYPEYDAKIGSAQGKMYQDQHVYWRNFSGGLVVVNPSNDNSYTVKTSSAGYSNLQGQAVSQSFTMPPHSGMILLHS